MQRKRKHITSTSLYRFSILSLLLFVVLCSAYSAFHRGRAGIIITGDSCCVRAMEPFTGTPSGGAHYPQALNLYHDSLPEVSIYSMVIPTSVELYCPDEARSLVRSEAAVMQAMYDSLRGITPVNILPLMMQHKDKCIYARTDHHWLPLAAYYAAQEFARVARVPFRDLSAYDEQVVCDVVGTMYKFSGDLSVNRAPEDFIYYTPKDTTYTTTYVGHKPGRGRGVYTLTEPFEGPFFIRYKDGASSAYCTFMGGDTRTTHVKAFGKNHRRLMIVKDSYGNALPGYLFYSFEDIYVVDFRYFQKNIIAYVRENGITDILFANNMQHAYNQKTSTGIQKLLYR